MLSCLAATLVCAGALRPLPLSNCSSVTQARGCFKRSESIDWLWCPACTLVGPEPLTQRGLCPTACHSEGQLAMHSTGVKFVSNASLPDAGPAWQPFVVMAVGELLGNIMRGVTGAVTSLLLTGYCVCSCTRRTRLTTKGAKLSSLCSFDGAHCASRCKYGPNFTSACTVGRKRS